jgi:hypothetical protein
VSLSGVRGTDGIASGRCAQEADVVPRDSVGERKHWDSLRRTARSDIGAFADMLREGGSVAPVRARMSTDAESTARFMLWHRQKRRSVLDA